jgi:protein SCO1/2
MQLLPRSFPVFGFPLALGSVAAGLAVWQALTAGAHTVLPTYGQVPAFVLQDQSGQPISRDVLKGHIWIADFIFTRCAGQCPMMSDRMAKLATAFRDHRLVKLVSFTVDPDWDTPQVLANYAKAYGASPDTWRFVTGTKEDIVRLCRDGFRLSVEEGAGTTDEPITHSVRLVLVDRDGNIRGYYDATEETALKRLQQDLRRLLPETS